MFGFFFYTEKEKKVGRHGKKAKGVSESDAGRSLATLETVHEIPAVLKKKKQKNRRSRDSPSSHRVLKYVSSNYRRPGCRGVSPDRHSISSSATRIHFNVGGSHSRFLCTRPLTTVSPPTESRQHQCQVVIAELPTRKRRLGFPHGTARHGKAHSTA